MSDRLLPRRVLAQLRALLQLQLRKIILVVTAVVVILLVVPPVGVLVFSVFRSTEAKLPFEATTFTLDNVINVFSSPVTYQLLMNTAWYALGSVGLGLIVAVVFAWLLERTNMPFRRLFFMLTLLPMGIPGIVLGMAWVLLANPANGVLNEILRALLGIEGPGPLVVYSIPGMILVTAMRFVPTMYLMISGVFARIDPSLEEASSTSGVRFWHTLRRISMPLLGPALLAALIYYIVMGIEVFETAALLGFPRRIYVFSTAIFYAVHPVSGLPNYGLASTYGLVLLTAAAVLIFAYRRYIGRTERFATVTGRGYRPGLIDLGRWRYVPALVMLGYFVVAVLMPLLILLWKSVAPAYASISLQALQMLTLDNFRMIVQYPGLLTAAKNSLVIAAAVASITMVVVTLLSWQSVRGRGGRAAAYSEYLAFVVLGVPGIVLALALIFIYAAVPIPFYGTIWIIIIGLVTLSLPFGTRLMSAAMLQIHRELEEAAAASGANLFPVLTRIVLPLLWPSFARGFLWVFVRCIGDATVTVMLLTPSNQTIAATLWAIWMSEGNFALASAIAVPMVLFSSVLALWVGRQTMLIGTRV